MPLYSRTLTYLEIFFVLCHDTHQSLIFMIFVITYKGLGTSTTVVMFNNSLFTHFWPWRFCHSVHSIFLLSPGSLNPADDICSLAGCQPNHSSRGAPAEPSFYPPSYVDKSLFHDIYVFCGVTSVQSERMPFVLVWEKSLPQCLTLPVVPRNHIFGFWNSIELEGRKMICVHKYIFSVWQVTPYSYWKDAHPQ